jgi:hypothetical protein
VLTHCFVSTRYHHRVRPCIVVLVAACSPAATSPTGSRPLIANAVRAPIATCVIAAEPDVHVADGALIACYPAAQPALDDCWSFNVKSAVWSFDQRIAHVARAKPVERTQVTATAAAARVCKADGSDCMTVPLSGITIDPQFPQLSGATNADRSIIAVWAGAGPVHVFDATGKRLTTIPPWKTDMDTTACCLDATHVLGTVLEVRDADSPVTEEIRLYDPRTGKEIGDVGHGMDIDVAPIALGGNQYAFLSFDPEQYLVVDDVTTGKQLARYELGKLGVPWGVTVERVGDRLAGVSQTTAFVIDRAGRVTVVAAPTCPAPANAPSPP